MREQVRTVQDYVSSFSDKINTRVETDSTKAFSLMVEGNLQKVEEIFQKQYEWMRRLERNLPIGQRYHKGGPLHNWGVFMLLQQTPQKISKGYRKILLAYIEDLLDFDTIDQVREAPAYKTLANNPSITSTLLDLVCQRAEERKTSRQIPRNPADVLKPISDKTKSALRKPIEITISQVKPSIGAWLEKKGPMEKRVFVGGNYRNIAVLRHIAHIVGELEFVPIMPIDMPATSKPSFGKLIHDISIEMLRQCTFAVFEVTISNGHLMEVERSKDFMREQNLKVVLVYQIMKPDERPTVTRMLMTEAFQKRGYRNFTALATIINHFLTQK